MSSWLHRRFGIIGMHRWGHRRLRPPRTRVWSVKSPFVAEGHFLNSSISFTGQLFQDNSVLILSFHHHVSITFVSLRSVHCSCRSRIQPTFIISNMHLDVYLSIQSHMQSQ